jgi:hypothetical protein
MDLILCWLVGPALLFAVAVGLSFCVELASGARLPWAVRPAMGLAAMILIAQLWVSTDATAELAIPFAVALGAFGLVMGWSAGLLAGPLPRWGIAAALGVYLIYGAPVLLSGEPTWAGFIKLDDTASWMAFADHAFEFGRNVDGFEPSTWEALIDINISNGYPIGSFVPMSLMATLTGQDVAWTVQPSMAAMAAMLSLLLFELLRPLLSGAAVRAAIAFLGAQSAMLLGYTLWGGVKEVAAAALLALAPMLAWLAIEQVRTARRPWVLPGLVAAAFLAVLGPGGAVWMLATMAPLLVWAWRELGRGPALALAWKAVALALVATLPQLITPNGFFDPFQSFLFAESELGNLPAPLSLDHVMGIWPAQDFRLDAKFGLAITILAVVLAGLAAFACWTALRDRKPLPAAYALGGAAAFALVYIVGSPWVDGKAMAIASPALLTAALAGAALLVQRSSGNIEGWLAGALAGGLILYTSMLFFQGVFLAPRDEHRELERIGERYAGEGPALVTEGSSYGPRHFLRLLDAENAKDLRRRPVTLADGGAPDELPFVDPDAIASASLAPYNLLVMRRSPFASRPPADFSLAEAGRYYEVWRRDGAAPPLQRLPLGEPPLENAAVPDCSAVESLAAAVGPAGTLVAARPTRALVLDLGTADAPDSWRLDGSYFLPDSSGALEAPVEVTAPGEWEVWVGGNILGGLAVAVGEERAPQRRQALNQNLYEPFGPFDLAAGPQTVTLDYSDGGPHPGAGADPTPLGPVVIARAGPPDRGTVEVAAPEYRRLCDQPWDWIEAYG